MFTLEAKNILKIEWEELTVEITTKQKGKITCFDVLEQISKSANKMIVTDGNFTSDPNRWCFEIKSKDITITLDGKPAKKEVEGE